MLSKPVTWWSLSLVTAVVLVALVAVRVMSPRLPGTGSPYAPLADSFPEFNLAYQGAYQAYDLPGVRVHAVPQMLTVEETLAALKKASSIKYRPPGDKA